MILVSCCNKDGGLFALDEQSLEPVRMLESEMRGIVYHDGLLYSCDHEGVSAWGLDLDRLSAWRVHHRAHAAQWHGLRIFDGCVYVVDSPDDSIHVFDLELNPLDDRTIRFRQPGEGHNIRRHINDLCFDSSGDLLFSSFSVEPKHKYTDGDGSIRRIHMDQIDMIENGLKHPHSVTTHYGSLYWCDSSTDRVMTRNRNGQIKSFDVVGYPRGLVITGKYIYVGTSRDRHDGLAKGEAGVVRITRKKPSESVTIPLAVKEVYGLLRI